ncbi:Txe/YoeB family addiction module toxin [Parvimonas parva]|uniref:Txe/YoeB family addiction module toxin n=1 Tax=Parvimonas parva TaxID=2769485 RepID=UPI0038B32E59
MEYRILISKKVKKDVELIKSLPNLKKNVDNLLKLISKNPFQTPPTYEKLVGNYKGMYSRRINRQHRLVYKVKEECKAVIIVSMWSYYEF